MKTPHKHAAIIHAWADGAEIEYREYPISGPWHARDNPSWLDEIEYRIKPKPDVVQKVKMWAGGEAKTSVLLRYSSVSYDVEGSNLKLTFDGETGQLKAAEVLK